MLSKLKISEILYRIDPMNLAGAPSDEYDPEAQEIFDRIHSLPYERSLDVNFVAQVVGTVLEYWFLNDIDLKRDTFQVIAAEIVGVIHDNSGDA